MANAREAAKQRRALEQEDTRWLLSTPAFRRFLRRVFSTCGEAVFVGASQREQDFRLGQADIGRSVRGWCEKEAPEQWLEMLRQELVSGRTEEINRDAQARELNETGELP